MRNVFLLLMACLFLSHPAVAGPPFQGALTPASVDSYGVTTSRISHVLRSHAAPTAGAESGESWNDSTRKAIQVFANGITQTYPGVLFVQTATTTVASSTSDTTLLGTGVGTSTLPANFFVAGKVLYFYNAGFMTTNGTPNFTNKFKLGTTTILSTGAVAAVSTPANMPWFFEGRLTCRTAGASGTIMAQGRFHYFSSTGVLKSLECLNATAVTFDTTAAAAPAHFITWGTSDAANLMSSTEFYTEAKN